MYCIPPCLNVPCPLCLPSLNSPTYISPFVSVSVPRPLGFPSFISPMYWAPLGRVFVCWASERNTGRNRMLMIAVEKRLSRFIVGSGSDWFSSTVVPPTQVGFKMELAAGYGGADLGKPWSHLFLPLLPMRLLGAG